MWRHDQDILRRQRADPAEHREHPDDARLSALRVGICRGDPVDCVEGRGIPDLLAQLPRRPGPLEIVAVVWSAALPINADSDHAKTGRERALALHIHFVPWISRAPMARNSASCFA